MRYFNLFRATLMAILGVGVSVVFTVLMIRETFGGELALTVLAVAVLFQLAQYGMTIDSRTTTKRIVVSILYLMSIAASYAHIAKSVSDDRSLLSFSNAADETSAQQSAKAQSTTYQIASDRYSLLLTSTSRLDSQLQALITSADKDIANGYRTRANETLKRVGALRDELRREQERLNVASVALDSAAQMTATSAATLKQTHLFDHVTAPVRHALFLLIATLIEVLAALGLIECATLLRQKGATPTGARAVARRTTPVAPTATPATVASNTRATGGASKPATDYTDALESVKARLLSLEWTPYPSQRKIIADTGLPERQIRALFKQLADDEMITKEGKKWRVSI